VGRWMPHCRRRRVWVWWWTITVGLSVPYGHNRFWLSSRAAQRTMRRKSATDGGLPRQHNSFPVQSEQSRPVVADVVAAHLSRAAAGVVRHRAGDRTWLGRYAAARTAYSDRGAGEPAVHRPVAGVVRDPARDHRDTDPRPAECDCGTHDLQHRTVG